MSVLIITLPLTPADTAALFDCVQSPDGRTVASHARVPLALLPATDRQTEVVAVVPLQALSWHQVQLPPGSLPRSLLAERGGNRLRAILDGLLEDQLLDEPAQLHLALQPQPQVGLPVWLAACDRAWLKAALAVVEQAGHSVTRIVPESSPQALSEVIEVTGEADRPRVAGLLAPAGEATAAGVLSCALSAAAVNLLDAGAAVVAEPAVVTLAEQVFQRAVTLQQRGERLLQAAHSPWDLAQFEFTNAQRDPRWAQLMQGLQQLARSPQWRAARWALLVLVLANVIGLNAWAWREQRVLAAQRAAIRAVLTDTFAKVPVVVDAPLQMAREVAALRRASGSAAGSDLESLLSSFSTLAPASYVPTTIEFAANELRLGGPAMTAQEQARVTAGLKAQGLMASVQGDQWLIRTGDTP
ncbi:type II secretion system protein GspL [Rhodoferax sp.]|uniref:type II secretion system protein GspL n=1 Tax=Rhodoferax sp. TaxID=50421 RepID=UPI002636673B|nr:type II secretion system protein GspL [Rhodoferax sp.]MDD2924317.1 type II secretion system protein GspL [Rhodoferax sp.]